MTISTEKLRTLIQEQLPGLVDVRHDLHAHPELGYGETRTSGVVQRELERSGVPFQAGLAGGTGVLGHLGGGTDGNDKAIGLRADMDALPIQEANDIDYRSTHDGVMHACGHDGHTTILLGAARVLARVAEATGGLPRPVTFLFQPAEESGAGAERMIQDGALDGSVIGPPVEQMFGLHGWPRVPLGCVGSKPGPMMAAADAFDITITGEACHAAWPHVGRDPIVAAAATVGALQSITSRNVSALDSIVVSVTQFHAGTAYNIIPGSADLAGTVRTLVAETQDLAENRLGQIATAVAEAYGCRAEIDFRRGYPPTNNEPAMVEVFRKVAADALGPQQVIDLAEPVMGGEDFSYYTHVVPSCFFVLGLVPKGAKAVPQLHQPTFDFNDDAIATGVEMFCRLALREA